MELSTWVFLGVIGLLAANQLAMRLGGLTGKVWVFYPLQLINILAGSAIIWFHLPGLEQWPIISWFVGLLFFFHTVQNTSHRSDWLREQREASTGTISERAAALRAALEAAEE